MFQSPVHFLKINHYFPHRLTDVPWNKVVMSKTVALVTTGILAMLYMFVAGGAILEQGWIILAGANPATAARYPILSTHC